MSGRLPDAGEIPLEIEPLVLAARTAEREGRQAEARARFEEALHTLRGSSHGPVVSSLLRWIAWTHANGGDPQAAVDCLTVAEVVAETEADDRALASVLNTRAGMLFDVGELDDAEVLFRRVRGLAWKIRDSKLQATADQHLGTVYSTRGDLPLALARFRASLATYEELGLEDHQAPLLNDIGRLLIDMGEESEAEAVLTRARTLCEETGDRHHQLMVEVNLAHLLLRSGRLIAALHACQEARLLAVCTGQDRWLAYIHLIAGGAYARQENHDLALAFLDRADGLAREHRNEKLLADVLLEQADLLRTLGRNADALNRLGEANGILHELRATAGDMDIESRVERVHRAILQVVRGWGESAERRDTFEQGHASRVAEYACMLAAAARLPEEDVTAVRMGALLHEIGKTRVPLSILHKKGPLDAGERRVVAEHPVRGVELLEGVTLPWDVRPLIRHHHERWDGTGYPDRLAGDRIPFAARILTIADVYDALISARSYRPGYTHEKALQIMLSERGTTFDPDLLDLFCEKVAPKLASVVPKPRRELVFSIPFPFVRSKPRGGAPGPVSATA